MPRSSPMPRRALYKCFPVDLIQLVYHGLGRGPDAGRVRGGLSFFQAPPKLTAAEAGRLPVTTQGMRLRPVRSSPFSCCEYLATKWPNVFAAERAIAGGLGELLGHGDLAPCREKPGDGRLSGARRDATHRHSSACPVVRRGALARAGLPLAPCVVASPCP